MVNNPNIRFAGFSDDWVQRKLKDVLREFSIKSKIENEHSVLSSTNSGMEFREGRVSGTSNLGYKIVKNGDLVLSPQNLWLGNININNIGKGLVSPSYKTFEFINIDSSFINPQLRTQKMLEEYKNSSTQGASVVRRNLEIDSFYQIKIFVPTISEQEKIGSLFSLLDNTITRHQRKLDLLKALKKGYLQKMFPKNDATEPEIRFAGFADEWEERKLSELIQKGGSGGTPKSTNKTFYDGNIPFLGISDISKSNGYIDNTEKHISENGLNNSSAWIVPKGAISLAMYASVGKLAILNINAATSQAFYNMVFEYESIRDYVYHRLGKANDLGEWTKLISTGTQANLNADKVKNFKIQVPQNIDEMTDISTFFNQLDNTIAHHQRKLDLLKDLKKGLSQQMFV